AWTHARANWPHVRLTDVEPPRVPRVLARAAKKACVLGPMRRVIPHCRRQHTWPRVLTHDATTANTASIRTRLAHAIGHWRRRRHRGCVALEARFGFGEHSAPAFLRNPRRSRICRHGSARDDDLLEPHAHRLEIEVQGDRPPANRDPSPPLLEPSSP